MFCFVWHWRRLISLSSIEKLFFKLQLVFLVLYLDFSAIVWCFRQFYGPLPVCAPYFSRDHIINNSDYSVLRGEVVYWRGPNYRKEFAVFQLFCNQNQEKHRKKSGGFKVNSSSIRQYTFCLEIQSINWGNPAFFDPSFCCTFRSHHTLLSEAVFLWA